jgi:hypothetical protein
MVLASYSASLFEEAVRVTGTIQTRDCRDITSIMHITYPRAQWLQASRSHVAVRRRLQQGWS